MLEPNFIKAALGCLILGAVLDAAAILSNLQKSVAAQRAPLISKSAIRQTARPSKRQG
jgi:hypothetical protein